MNAWTDRDSDRRFSEGLDQLRSVLEAEKQALMDGDAKTIAALAAEKERLSDLLGTLRQELPETSAVSDEIKALATQVEELARLNHLLLKEVYQYYHGMVELFMRIGGQGKTYGKNGYINVDPTPKRDREILA